MKVRELIERLQKLNPEAEVLLLAESGPEALVAVNQSQVNDTTIYLTGEDA